MGCDNLFELGSGIVVLDEDEIHFKQLMIGITLIFGQLLGEKYNTESEDEE